MLFPRAFVSLSWLGISFQLVVFCLMLGDMFLDHVHLSWAQYLILCTIIDSIFNSMLTFSLWKSERHVFTFTLFSRDLP